MVRVLQNLDKRPAFAYVSEFEKYEHSDIKKLTEAGGVISDGKKDERHRNYDKWLKLYKGKHKEVLAKDGNEELKDRYTVFNILKTIIKNYANLVITQKISATTEDENVQKWLDEYIKRTKLFVNIEEMVISMLSLGGVVVKTYYDHKNRVKTDILHPSNFEALFDPWNGSEPLGCRLEFINTGGSVDLKRVETYMENEYVIENYRKKKGDSRWELINRDFQAHNAGMLVHYISFNADPFEYYGKGISEDIEDLIAEANNRVTMLKRVLDIFSMPKLILPPSIFRTLVNHTGQNVTVDGQGNEYITIEDTDIYCFSPERDGEQKPEYLVWNAETTAAFEQLFSILDMIAVMTGMPSHALKGDTKATYPESAKALNLRYMQAIAVVNSITEKICSTLEIVLQEALKLEFYTLNSTVKEAEIQVFPSGSALPIDNEAVQLEITKYTSKLQSRVSTVQNINQLTKSEAIAEIEEIEQEQSAQRTQEESNFENRQTFDVDAFLTQQVRPKENEVEANV